MAITLTITILIIGTFFYFFAASKPSGIVASSTKEMNPDIPQKQINSNENIAQETDYKYQIYGVQNNNIYMKSNSDGMQKLFYYHPVDEFINIPLSEGNLAEYQVHSIGGQKYYPLIIGYEEAKIMREEGLFNNIGDPIKNFFGKNMVVVGVMQRTDGALDMAHLIPLNSKELN